MVTESRIKILMRRFKRFEERMSTQSKDIVGAAIWDRLWGESDSDERLKL